MSRTVKADFFFDPVSPFAYLMWKRLQRESPRSGTKLELRPVPVLLGAMLRHWGLLGPAEVPPKREQTYRMCQWLATRHAITFRFPDRHPFRSVEALRLLVALEGREDAVDRVFEAVFVEGRDIADLAEVNALGLELGLEDVASILWESAIKTRLRFNTEQAIANGVFGVPTIRIEESLFWGFDCFEMIGDYLADTAWFRSQEMQRLAQLDYGIKTAVRA